MDRRILGVLMILAFAAVCLGDESGDVSEEFGTTQVPWGEHKGPESSGPHKHCKSPFDKGGPVCVVVHDCSSEIIQLDKKIRESKDTKVCNKQFWGCMENVRNTESSKIVYPENCLNGVKNVFHMN